MWVVASPSRIRALPLAVLASAVGALVVPVAWAASSAGHDAGWMMVRTGTGMMGYSRDADGEPVRNIAEARRQAQRLADRLDLATGEVMRFTNHYYVELEENGSPATEVPVDPATSAVWLEYGPAMMWNTRFGMMGDSGLGPMGTMMGRATMGSGMMSGAGMMGGSGFADPTWGARARPGTTGGTGASCR